MARHFSMACFCHIFPKSLHLLMMPQPACACRVVPGGTRAKTLCQHLVSIKYMIECSMMTLLTSSPVCLGDVAVSLMTAAYPESRSPMTCGRMARHGAVLCESTDLRCELPLCLSLPSPRQLWQSPPCTRHAGAG